MWKQCNDVQHVEDDAAPGWRDILFGDTGDGPHIQDIARRFAGFDLVATELDR